MLISSRQWKSITYLLEFIFKLSQWIFILHSCSCLFSQTMPTIVSSADLIQYRHWIILMPIISPFATYRKETLSILGRSSCSLILIKPLILFLTDSRMSWPLYLSNASDNSIKLLPFVLKHLFCNFYTQIVCWKWKISFLKLFPF